MNTTLLKSVVVNAVENKKMTDCSAWNNLNVFFSDLKVSELGFQPKWNCRSHITNVDKSSEYVTTSDSRHSIHGYPTLSKAIWDALNKNAFYQYLQNLVNEDIETAKELLEPIFDKIEETIGNLSGIYCPLTITTEQALCALGCDTDLEFLQSEIENISRNLDEALDCNVVEDYDAEQLATMLVNKMRKDNPKDMISLAQIYEYIMEEGKYGRCVKILDEETDITYTIFNYNGGGTLSMGIYCDDVDDETYHYSLTDINTDISSEYVLVYKGE